MLTRRAQRGFFPGDFAPGIVSKLARHSEVALGILGGVERDFGRFGVRCEVGLALQGACCILGSVDTYPIDCTRGLSTDERARVRRVYARHAALAGDTVSATWTPVTCDVIEGFWICSDCLQFIANGDLPPDADAARENEILHGVNNQEGYSWSLGTDTEGSFSWRYCDCCGSQLGGDRYSAALVRCSQPK